MGENTAISQLRVADETEHREGEQGIGTGWKLLRKAISLCPVRSRNRDRGADGTALRSIVALCGSRSRRLLSRETIAGSA